MVERKRYVIITYEEIPAKTKSGGMVFNWDNHYFTHENTEKDNDGNRGMMIQGKLHINVILLASHLFLFMLLLNPMKERNYMKIL